jgi:hypothetical protein
MGALPQIETEKKNYSPINHFEGFFHLRSPTIVAVICRFPSIVDMGSGSSPSETVPSSITFSRKLSVCAFNPLGSTVLILSAFYYFRFVKSIVSLRTCKNLENGEKKFSLT